LENGAKIGLGVTAVMVLAIGVRVALIYHANHSDGPPVKNAYEKPKLTDDDMVFLRKQRPDSLKDERALVGTTIWVSAGGQMDYYPYASHHADYAHRAGTLAGATPMLIKDVFEQVAPHSGRPVARIPAGQKHVLLAFTLPQSPDPKKEYATPIGFYENGNYTFFSDEIFFYDDPRVLYKHWGTEMWAHIDKHEAVPGMSENQAMMSLGQVIVPSSDNFGNRTVKYDNDGHPVKIEFENNKAVSVKSDE
jgi:hypothetical protein